MWVKNLKLNSGQSSQCLNKIFHVLLPLLFPLLGCTQSITNGQNEVGLSGKTRTFLGKIKPSASPKEELVCKTLKKMHVENPSDGGKLSSLTDFA